jgi:hypothetical protein
MKTVLFTLALGLAAAASTPSFSQDGPGLSRVYQAVGPRAGKPGRVHGLHIDQPHVPTGPEIVNQPPFQSAS